MGLHRIDGIRFTSVLLALGLLGVATPGCDKGLAKRIDDKKDERFKEAETKLARLVSQRLSASVAVKELFQVAVPARKALRTHPIDNLHTVLNGLRSLFLDENGDAVKGADGKPAENLWLKYSALGTLEKMAKKERARSEASALAVAVEKMTTADSADNIVANRKELVGKFADAYGAAAYRKHWIANVPRLRLEAKNGCFKTCKKSCMSVCDEATKCKDPKDCPQAAQCTERKRDWMGKCSDCIECLDTSTQSLFPLYEDQHKQKVGKAPDDKDTKGSGCYEGTPKPEAPVALKKRLRKEARLKKDGEPVPAYVPDYIPKPAREIAQCVRSKAKERAESILKAYKAGNPSESAFAGKKLVDPWDQPYAYSFPSARSKDELAFDVCSSGVDMKAGTPDDVCDFGTAVKTLSEYREDIVKRNGERAKDALKQSKRRKGGESASLIRAILDANLLLGAMEGIESVKQGTDPLVAWRYFVGSWNTLAAYDALKNEYRGTPTAKMAMTARSYVRESTEFWKAARNNKLNKMSGVVDRYSQFIDNYLRDTEKDYKTACIGACGQIFEEMASEDKFRVESCRMQCIPKAAQDSVNDCKATQQTKLKACPPVEGDAMQQEEALDCKRRANAKGVRCIRRAFGVATASAHAKDTAETNNFYIQRPFLTEAAFDRVFVHMAADRVNANRVPFYALAFDFPGRTKDTARRYFGRACQQSAALRDTCRSVPAELREEVSLAPYLFRTYRSANAFLRSQATGVTGDPHSKLAASCKQEHKDDLKREHCVRSGVQVAAAASVKVCLAGHTTAKKACQTAYETRTKVEKAKLKAAKGVIRVAIEKRVGEKMQALQKERTSCAQEASQGRDTCFSEKFDIDFEAPDEKLQPYVDTIQAYRKQLGLGLALITAPKEDPVLPNSLSPEGGGGFGLTIEFTTLSKEAKENGIYMGSGERSAGSQWSQVSGDAKLSAGVSKDLAGKIASTYASLTKEIKGSRIDPERLQIAAPGTLTAGAIAGLINALPMEAPEVGEDEDPPPIVREITLLSRRRVDDSMKRTKLVLKRSPGWARGSSFYKFKGDSESTKCTYLGRAGSNFGLQRGQGNILIYDKKKLVAASVKDCEWGVEEDGRTCKPTPKAPEGDEDKKQAEVEPTPVRLFLEKRSAGRLDVEKLAGAGSWASQRSLEETSEKPEWDEQYKKLSTWLDEKKNRGTLRVFVPSDLSYEALVTLVSVLRFKCEDRAFQTITEKAGPRGVTYDKKTYYLACGSAKRRSSAVHISVCK